MNKMKSIEQIINEIDKYGIHKEMISFRQEVDRIGDMSGDQSSTYENKYHLISAKVTQLLSDAEEYLAIKERKKEDKLNDLRAVSEEKSEAAKEREAKCNPDWRELADDVAIAKVVYNKLFNQKKWFDSGVFICRSRQENQKKDWYTVPSTES
jgi:ElaB/YqjD/DUF883 family membrane-anchored ribosome-binding protein